MWLSTAMSSIESSKGRLSIERLPVLSSLCADSKSAEPLWTRGDLISFSVLSSEGAKVSTLTRFIVISEIILELLQLSLESASSGNGKLSKLNSSPKSESSNFGGSTLSFWPAGLCFCDSCLGFSNTSMSLEIEKHVVSEMFPLSIGLSRPTGHCFCALHQEMMSGAPWGSESSESS